MPQPLLQQPQAQHQPNAPAEGAGIRRNPRLKNKTRKPKPPIKLAQEVLAKKWGILTQDEDMDELTLQQYLDLYRKPLSAPALQDIKTLTLVVELKKGKKKRKTSVLNAGLMKKTKGKLQAAVPGA